LAWGKERGGGGGGRIGEENDKTQLEIFEC